MGEGGEDDERDVGPRWRGPCYFRFRWLDPLDYIVWLISKVNIHISSFTLILSLIFLKFFVGTFMM